jgi:hypothetical protein
VTTLWLLLRRTSGLLYRFPLALLALQSFDLVSEAALSLMEAQEGSRVLFAAVTFPVVWFMMAFSLAVTTDFGRREQAGEAGGIAPSLRALGDKMKPLLASVAMTGVLVIVGLMVLLPGIYFLTLYLFVPCFVMVLPKASAFTYLAEAKALARGRFFALLALAIGVNLLSLGLDELQSLFEMPGLGLAARVLPRLVCTLVLGATINTFLTVCFLHLTEDRRA